MTDLVEELAKEDGEFAHIKGFRLIHRTSKYFRLISKEIADSLNRPPGTHVG